MKKEIPPYIIIVAIVLLVAIVGYYGYKVMNPQVEFVEDPKKNKERMIEAMKQYSGQGAPVPPASPATTQTKP